MPRFLVAATAAVTAAALTFAGAVAAKPMMPTNAPIERLLTNVMAYVHTHPEDPNGFFTLGRLHYFAFAAPRDTIEVRRGTDEAGPDTLPVLGGPFSPPGHATAPGETVGATPPRLTPAARAAHVKEALKNITKAIALRDAPRPPDARRTQSVIAPGVYELCLACVYDDGKTDAAKDWREKAIALYKKAWEASYPRDSKLGATPLFGIDKLVSREAGQSYLRLVQARGAKPAEQKTVAAVTGSMTTLEKLPPGPVTPIVFSLDSAAPLANLIAPRPKGVRFDLDGSGRLSGQVYRAWPKRDTAILIWDPAGAGRVVSGRQMFGGATWWMFWNNGYAALDSLDDDRDGWLTGKELSGLALWFDRNGNGISEAGEVISLAETPIAALATKATSTAEGGSPANSAGLRLQDGRALPTYDWTVQPRP